jgi:hypothetical protein
MDLKVDTVRAKTPQRMPTVLSKEEVVASSGATQRLRPLVAFSCALRRYKLDGSESWPSSSSAPNLLRNLGSRPSFAFCDSGRLAALSSTIFDRLGVDHLNLASKRSRRKHADGCHNEWLLPNSYPGVRSCLKRRKAASFDGYLFLGQGRQRSK